MHCKRKLPSLGISEANVEYKTVILFFSKLLFLALLNFYGDMNLVANRLHLTLVSFLLLRHYVVQVDIRASDGIITTFLTRLSAGVLPLSQLGVPAGGLSPCFWWDGLSSCLFLFKAVVHLFSALQYA